MEKKNKRLLMVIAGLFILNFLLLSSGNSSASTDFDEKMFAIQDTSSVKSVQIGDIILRRAQNNNLRAQDDQDQKSGWNVDEYPADPAFVDHLLNVMLRVRVKKPVGTMTKGGVPIRIEGYEPFQFAWNETKTKTFFIRNEQGYEVEIPGFTDYLGGIFELEEDQWRDRLVYDGSWRTIQKLTLDYAADDQHDFSIEFEQDFFKIPGVQKIDTAVMMNYLNQFEYFQANERISEGRIPAMDSLYRTEPLAELTIDDINQKTPIKFRIYPRRPQDGFYLLLDPTGQMIAVDVQRTAEILLEKSDFQYEK
ncbi:MAG: hypothetical protein RIF46_08815 [Cyclobacteriaceae bacterium]